MNEIKGMYCSLKVQVSVYSVIGLLPCLVVSKSSFVGVAFKNQLRNVGVSSSFL